MTTSPSSGLVSIDFAYSGRVAEMRMLTKTSSHTEITAFSELNITDLPNSVVEMIEATEATHAALAANREAGALLRSYKYATAIAEAVENDEEVPLDQTDRLKADSRGASVKLAALQARQKASVRQATDDVRAVATAVAVDTDKAISAEVGKLIKQLDSFDVAPLERLLRARAWSQVPTASLDTVRGESVGVGVPDASITDLRATLENLR